MNDIVEYKECPLCKSTNFEKVLQAKDFTVSGEIFDIYHCNNCTARFTQRVPSPEKIAEYYQSPEYISHSDTKQGLINRLYHIVRNHTLQSKRKLVENLSGGEKRVLLDIGAGTGAFLSVMKEAGWNVTGLEPDAIARENAQTKYNIHLQQMSALFELPENNLDVITLWHVLEHVHQLHEYTEVFKKVLKDNGTILIAVPNYTSRDAEIYGEYWAGYDVPRHLYHFSPKSMQLLMRLHGLAVIDYKAMWYDSFYVSMLSEQYKSGKNNLTNAVWNGFKSNVKAAEDVQQCSSLIYIVKKKIQYD